MSIADTAIPHIAVKSADGIAELQKCRAQMRRVLAIYNLFLNREVLDPLIRDGGPAIADEARTLKAEIVSLLTDFRAYAAHWHERKIITDWRKYQAEAAGFAKRILTHIASAMTLAGKPISKASGAVAVYVTRI